MEIYIGIVVISALIGFGIGSVIMYHIYKCGEHQWEKIIDDTTVNKNGNTTGHIMVHMCKKCGKRKITKV